MPIRFACEHCESTLSVSSRKAGQEVTCPKCRQKTPVPQASLQPAPAATAVQKPVPESTSESKALSKPAAKSEPLTKIDTPVKSEPAPLAPASARNPASTNTTVASTQSPAPSPPAIELPEAPRSDAAPLGPPLFDYETPYDEQDDDEVAWVYEDAAGRQSTGGFDSHSVDFDRISLPRYVLYGQGVLLIAVAMTALTLGILIGRGTAPRVVEKSGAPTPCFLTGTVEYASRSGAHVPDAGAVVIVVPQDKRLADKAPIEGLRPEDPMPAADLPSLSRIRSIGGDYTRADDQGYFKLRVPDTGDYFLLVVSRQTQRKASERLEPVHLAQIGRYFLPAPDLIGDHKYRWRAETVKRDKEYKFTFE